MKDRTARKTKKSFTLAPETVEFLEAMRKKRHAESVSSVLEEILQTVRREQERARIDRAVSDYYTSLSDSERTEEAKWGDFALREFPDPERA
jgi:hypothetical protein